MTVDATTAELALQALGVYTDHRAPDVLELLIKELEALDATTAYDDNSLPFGSDHLDQINFLARLIARLKVGLAMAYSDIEEWEKGGRETALMMAEIKYDPEAYKRRFPHVPRSKWRGFFSRHKAGA